MKMTAKIDPVGLDGEIGRWRGNRRSADQWGRGLIAGQKFSDRLELYAELQDLQDIDKIGGAAKQRELTLDKLDKSDKGGRGIQAATKHNSEPNWIAYLGGGRSGWGPGDEANPGETPAAKR